jgi:hypothetical protein
MTDNNTPETPQGLTIEDLKSALSEMRSGLKDELMGETNRAITGAFTKYRKSQETAETPDIENIIEQKLRSVLDGVLQEPEQQQGQQPQQKEGEPVDIEALIKQRVQEAVTPYQQAVEKARQEAEQERLNTAKATARNEYLQKLSGKVQNPKLFMTALESEKGLTYDADKKQWGIPGQDEFQNPTFTPLSQLELDTVLQSEDFSIFKPQRPGNGLGSAPNGTEPQPPQPGQNALPADPVKRMASLKKSADPMADIVANLSKTVQS